MARVLVISAHPDDETLGMGGTLLRHVAAEDTVRWAVVSAGWEPRWSASALTAKDAEIEAVAAAYGIAAPHRARLPATRLADLPLNEVIDGLAPAFHEAPEIVYCVHPGDVHTDHRAVFDAAWVLAKPFRAGRGGVRRFLCFETLSSTDAAPPDLHRAFQPTAWSELDAEHVEAKVRIMGLYASETQPEPLPRAPSAIRALARLRGAQVGVPHAEAFRVLRHLW
jgi:LmbE family N-acetylglucosaminyl deacetylase